METQLNSEITQEQLEKMYTQQLSQLIELFKELTDLIDFRYLIELLHTLDLAKKDKRCDICPKFDRLITQTYSNFYPLWSALNRYLTTPLSEVNIRKSSSISKEYRAELLIKLFRCRSIKDSYNISQNKSIDHVVSCLNEIKNKCNNTQRNLDELANSTLPFKITPRLQKQFDKFEKITILRKCITDTIDALVDLSKQCVTVSWNKEQRHISEEFQSSFVRIFQQDSVFVNPVTC